MVTVSAHCVRRYGPVGGMETYVYELTKSLVQKGHKVIVLCEVCEVEEVPAGVEVVCLGNAFRKPRWLAQWGFAKRVASYAPKLPEATVIHSHERTGVHHVTTFHGPPFLNRKKRLLDGLSPRIRMWTALEKAELTGEQVRVILPNSTLIADQLRSFYPQVANKVGWPAYPGVAAIFSQIEPQPKGDWHIGFLGREWKRKGLDIACRIVEKLREQEPRLHFTVAGCNPDEIRHLFQAWPEDSYTLAGWIEPQEFLGSISLLLHPARAEPFGMAVAEANAAGIPVVVSDQCGVASLIRPSQGAVCSLAEEEPWIDACRQLLSGIRENAAPVPSLNLTWESLADQHITLYQSIQKTL